jgi:hypothetical protein
MVRLRWAAVLAVLLAPVPATADLQVINTVPEGTLRFFEPNDAQGPGYTVVLGPCYLGGNSYLGPYLLCSNPMCGHGGRVLWVDELNGFIRCERLEGANDLPLFGVIPARAYRDGDDVVLELYGVDYVDRERRVDLFWRAQGYGGKRPSPEELREAVYRVTIRWDRRSHWRVERVERVVDLPLGYEVAGDGLYFGDYLLVPAMRRQDGRYVMLRIGLNDGRVEELLELPLSRSKQTGYYHFATRYSTRRWNAVWDVYGDYGPGGEYLLVAWVDRSDGGYALRYVVYDYLDGSPLREGSFGLDFEPNRLEIYGPLVLVSGIDIDRGEVRGKVYDFFSVEEGGKEVFSGPVCSMARSSLEWSPSSSVARESGRSVVYPGESADSRTGSTSTRCSRPVWWCSVNIGTPITGTGASGAGWCRGSKSHEPSRRGPG